MRKLELFGYYKQEDLIHFVEQMIEKAKLKLNSSESLFTLLLKPHVLIKTALTIQQMLEKEIFMNQKLKVLFLNYKYNKDDFRDVITKIDEEKHPIVHQFIKMKANQLEEHGESDSDYY